MSKPHHSEFAQCYECLTSLIGIVDRRVRLYCDKCERDLKVKPEENRAIFSPLVLRIRDND